MISMSKRFLLYSQYLAKGDNRAFREMAADVV
jgi:hypothetical protein